MCSLLPAVQISLREIERRLKTVSWIYLRKDKLVRTMEYVERVRETTKEYQERRLRSVVDQQLASGAFLVPATVVRMASLKYGE